MAKFKFKFYKKFGNPNETMEIEADDSTAARNQLRNAIGEEYRDSLQILSCIKTKNSVYSTTLRIKAVR